MNSSMQCPLCKERSGKRHCPGARAYICTLCCGREREVSIDCPYECPHLQDAYRNEGLRAEPPEKLVFSEHEVSDAFLDEQAPFIAGLTLTLLDYARDGSGVHDDDLRAVIDSLVRTYQTLASGLVYETLPDGQLRVDLYRRIQQFVQDWRRRQSEQAGITTPRDGDVLRSLVFLARTAQGRQNNRPRGRSFLAFLRRAFPAAARQHQNLIVPGR
jgi:hypothetical protein